MPAYFYMADLGELVQPPWSLECQPDGIDIGGCSTKACCCNRTTTMLSQGSNFWRSKPSKPKQRSLLSEEKLRIRISMRLKDRTDPTVNIRSDRDCLPTIYHVLP